jgi:ribosomal protein S18 acetylase RimI-like enzyme
MSIMVRQATPTDAPAVVELIGELARNYGETSPITQEYVGEYLAFPGNSILLAQEEGRVAGLLSYSLRPNLYHAANSALIEELVVRESARGRGVGSALMAELLRRLPSQGCAEVSVTTMPDNEGAIRFYRSHGLVDQAVFLEKHLFTGIGSAPAAASLP